MNDAVPLPPGYRASGVLLHLTSLPSPFGIGDFGPVAIAWIDALADAKQSWWQFLPLGPTGLGDSPYQSPSTFALNEMLVSPELLFADRLLGEATQTPPRFSEEFVDYSAVALFKNSLLDRAWSAFRGGANRKLQDEFDQFRQQHAAWLDDYTLFRALGRKHGDGDFLQWPAEIVQREPAALDTARRELAELIESYQFRQFLVFRQASAMHLHAARRGVKLIGDLPIFVAPNSADMWAHPELFLLDDERRPTFVAGVPPDYFSPTGQLWGSPLYNWEAQRPTGFAWWIERLRHTLGLVDLIRLDHFRGFEAAWHIPAGAETAIDGQWVPGPGGDLLAQVRDELHGLPLIAEDLGMITHAVRALRDEFHLPGMRVLQFAFDGTPDNPFLPHTYIPNTVVYTGTHDNDTTRGWFETLPLDVRDRVWTCLCRAPGTSAEVTWELIRLALESVASLAIIPAQDLLNLGTEARMNMPGTATGNWRWRLKTDQPIAAALEKLRTLTERSRRAP